MPAPRHTAPSGFSLLTLASDAERMIRIIVKRGPVAVPSTNDTPARLRSHLRDVCDGMGRQFEIARTTAQLCRRSEQAHKPVELITGPAWTSDQRRRRAAIPALEFERTSAATSGADRDATRPHSCAQLDIHAAAMLVRHELDSFTEVPDVQFSDLPGLLATPCLQLATAAVSVAAGAAAATASTGHPPPSRGALDVCRVCERRRGPAHHLN